VGKLIQRRVILLAQSWQAPQDMITALWKGGHFLWSLLGTIWVSLPNLSHFQRVLVSPGS
jgi:hypothetical protein